MKIIITIIAFLAMGMTYADNRPQRVCVSIDKNAHNSIWTRRDNTAKLHIYAKYRNYGFYTYSSGRYLYAGSNRLIELKYGQPAFCENVNVPKDLPNRQGYAFDNNIKIGVQYGGDCEFNYQPNKTVNVTIHHRRGNLVEPWSCTAR